MKLETLFMTPPAGGIRGQQVMPLGEWPPVERKPGTPHQLAMWRASRERNHARRLAQQAAFRARRDELKAKGGKR